VAHEPENPYFVTTDTQGRKIKVLHLTYALRWAVSPPCFEARITCRNEGERVLDLGAVAFAIEVDGGRRESHGAWTGDAARLAPGATATHTITGPSVAGFEALTTVTVAAYDVPAEVDERGEVLRLQTVRWRFIAQVSEEQREVTHEVRTERVVVDSAGRPLGVPFE
jgi:hypothetical protein